MDIQRWAARGGRDRPGWRRRSPIAYTKQCVNYRFSFDGYPVNVTVERIAELADDYMEVETVVADGADRGAARAVISAIFDAVGFGVNDLDPRATSIWSARPARPPFDSLRILVKWFRTGTAPRHRCGVSVHVGRSCHRGRGATLGERLR